MSVAVDFFQDLKRRGVPCEMELSELARLYSDWINKELPDVMRFVNSDRDCWQSLMHDPALRPFAQLARMLVSLPCAEVANERCFSVKRYIVGKCATRTSPELLTARARLAMDF